MDWLAFIASLVGSLAWPITILAVAFLFRRGIAATLARPLRRMKAGPIEAEWEEQAAEALVDVAKSPESGNAPTWAEPNLTHRLRTVAEASPRGAILEAYAEVEQLLRRKLIEAHYLEPDRRPMSARQLAEAAVQRELISPQIAEAIRGLTVMRNLAAHGRAEELDGRKALDYLVLADAILYAIDPSTQRPTTP